MLANRVDCLVEWAFPCGTYPDINIEQKWLIYKLDDEVSKVVPADGGYNDRRQYFIMPSGQHDYNML